jgi:gamma-glutamyl:cysteine ligase YbdK (ATP-grasp superfamily)
MFEQFTLGIEEEFQIVDPKTRELSLTFRKSWKKGNYFWVKK